MFRLCLCTTRRQFTRLTALEVVVRRDAALARPRFFSIFPKAPTSSQDDENVTVNWYEQLPSGQIRRTSSGDEEDPEMAGLEEEMVKLEREIEKSDVGNNLSPRQRRELEHMYALAQKEGLNDHTKLYADGSVLIIPEVEGLSEWQKKGIQSFCIALQRSTAPGAERLWNAHAPKLFQYYRHFKQAIPDFGRRLPPETWNILWQQYFMWNTHNREKPTIEIKELLAEISAATGELSPEQETFYITTSQLDEKSEEALKRWREARDRILQDPQYAQEFAELGVRIHAVNEGPESAQRLAFELIESQQNVYGLPLLTPVMREWLRRDSEQGVRHALSLYLYLRAHLSDKIDADDFAYIIQAYVEAKNVRGALVIFKDYLLGCHPSGQPVDEDEQPVLKPEHDSVAIYERYLPECAELNIKKPFFENTSKISASGIYVLPAVVNCASFYSLWLHYILRNGSRQDGFETLKIMADKNIRAKKTPINMLLTLGLRSASRRDQAQAMQLGLTMIRRGRELDEGSRNLNWADETSSSRSIEDPETDLLPPNVRKILPSPSVRTYGLLLEFFSKHVMLGSMERLLEDFRNSSVIPSSYWFAETILAHGRTGHLKRSAGIFKKIREEGTSEDFSIWVFAALFSCVKRMYMDPRVRRRHVLPSKPDFPEPRSVFSSLMNWFGSLTPDRKEEAKLQFNRGLYYKIIYCFCLAGDHQATLVALHGLLHSFGMLPDSKTVRMITISIAQFFESPATFAKRHRHRTTRETKERYKELSKLLIRLREEHGQDVQAILEAEGDEGEKEGKVSLFLLTDFIKTIWRHREAENPDLQITEEIAQLAFAMGTGGWRIDDLVPRRPGQLALAGGEVVYERGSLGNSQRENAPHLREAMAKGPWIATGG